MKYIDFEDLRQHRHLQERYLLIGNAADIPTLSGLRKILTSTLETVIVIDFKRKFFLSVEFSLRFFISLVEARYTGESNQIIIVRGLKDDDYLELESALQKHAHQKKLKYGSFFVLVQKVGFPPKPVGVISKLQQDLWTFACEKRVITKEQVAQHFGISEDCARRRIKTLSKAGVLLKAQSKGIASYQPCYMADSPEQSLMDSRAS